jgi:hypothetical protein
VRIRGPRRRDDAVTPRRRPQVAAASPAMVLRSPRRPPATCRQPAASSPATCVVCQRALLAACAPPRSGMKPPAVRGGCSRRSARESATSWSTSMDSGASPEAWRRYTATGRHIRDPGQHGQPSPGRNRSGNCIYVEPIFRASDVSSRARCSSLTLHLEYVGDVVNVADAPPHGGSAAPPAASLTCQRRISPVAPWTFPHPLQYLYFPDRLEPRGCRAGGLLTSEIFRAKCPIGPGYPGCECSARS